ncbi:MAG: Unknown protein [uncultured Sulfurovum sp.]|uniref:Nitric oxide-responding transcriptional regulator Dnr (Crp/Fnr family) n=1 Tax=uncultured Sulfurovum sp. TaxID=269237 RepID=A0A6S6SVW5_9BACT|nr:MAG: Unknown protein [uncultured Sulfurovum sp.]
MYRLYTTIVILFFTSTLFANASISHSQYTELTNIVKQQQFLAKNILEEYINFQADQKSHPKKVKMQTSIQNFNTNHKKLINNKNNTKIINDKLAKVSARWKVVNNLSETKELPSFVIASMKNINKKLKELSKLYKATNR